MSMKKLILFLITISCIDVSTAYAKSVKYQFDIDHTNVNFTGNNIRTIAINNQIPGPTIIAEVGDMLEITVNNHLKESTSLHWHGVILPNDQDGVPLLNTTPIAPGKSFTYKYEVKVPGTYWYHSHSGLQEQQGLYGSIIFYPKYDNIKSDQEHVIVLSEWNDEHPEKVLANLKKDGDYYALKKDTVTSWYKIIQHGFSATVHRIKSAIHRMNAMDLSDIGYDTFLLNGQKESHINATAGQTIRLRIINAGSSTYFNVEFANSPMTIVAADGVDVEPIKVKRLRIAMAETYDVLVPIKHNNSYEFRATANDGTGMASVFIGNGDKIYAPDIPKPDLLAMHMDMTGKNMSKMKGKSTMHMPTMHMHGMMHQSDMAGSVIQYMNDYDSLIALENTSFDTTQERREYTLKLTGNMERYVWSFNNKILTEDAQVLIKRGEVVQITLDNETMMNHPIHLHGHFFRVLGKNGNRSLLKHTVNVPPLEKVIIEFEANEEKDWFFHCHNLYHLKAGMARIISYEDSTKVTHDTVKQLVHDKWYFMGDIAALSNMTMGTLRSSTARNSIELEYDYDYDKKYDIDLIYSRDITRFFAIYAGGNFERESSREKPENKAILGLRYTLPLLVEADLRVDSKKKVRLELSSDMQLTDRLKFDWSYNTDDEYRFNMIYEINKSLYVIGTYDSDFKWGGGLRFSF